jgi:hypothetical protein
MCDRRDSQKKRFIDTLAVQGTVWPAAQARGFLAIRHIAGAWMIVSFGLVGYEALDTAIDGLKAALYQKAKNGDTVL